MPEFSESITIRAPVAAVWRTLADIGGIHQWNPGVEHSYQTSTGAVGTGASRHCKLGGKNYLDEEVVRFDPDRELTVRITKTNLPFEFADIRFVLAEAGSGTIVTVSPAYRLKYGVLGAALNMLFVSRQYRKGMRNLLRGLKTHVEAGTPAR